VRPEGFSQWKITMTTLRIKPMTLWLVAQCLNHATVYSVGIDKRMILKWVLEEQGVSVWIGLISLKIWLSESFDQQWKDFSGYLKKKKELLDYLSDQWLLKTAPRSQWLWKFKTFSATATSIGNTNSSIATTTSQTSDNGQCSTYVLTYRGYLLLV
jgi:hypothetical protein